MKLSAHSQQPIGVFDSGVGGLTVLKTLMEHWPHENFVYFGDTARLPYGTKSPETIYKYSMQIIGYLRQHPVKAIVIACNTASSHCIEPFIENIPLFNVIEPGSRAAIKSSLNKRIGLLGTRATLLSQSYQKKIKTLDPSAKVFGQACPLFVPLAEEGLIDDPMTDLAAYRYIQPLLQEKVDTIILGCTHYPILKKAIQKVAGPSITLIESGEALSLWIKETMDQGALAQNTVSSENRKVEILSTDGGEHFQNLALQILDVTDFSSKNILYRMVDLSG